MTVPSDLTNWWVYNQSYGNTYNGANILGSLGDFEGTASQSITIGDLEVYTIASAPASSVPEGGSTLALLSLTLAGIAGFFIIGGTNTKSISS